jgi:diketogulonate reductase-like aldo/keto reductase
MDRKLFGWSNISLPVIGQGTWRMGETQRQRDREIEALSLGIDLGLTHIDTAEMYGSGGAEEVVAWALRGRRRDQLFIATKVLPENASYKGTIQAAERSLQRLRTDYLDLYLLHWPGRHPIGETMRAMEDLVAAGKVRLFGVSNFDVDELRAAMAALTRERLTCNQVLYNLGQRGIECDLLPFCEREGIAVVAYTPFGNLPRQRSEEWRVLERIGMVHGKTPRQVTLRFLSRGPTLFTIPKATAVEHVRENAAATGFTLTDADFAAIDRAFPAPRRKLPLATG